MIAVLMLVLGAAAVPASSASPACAPPPSEVLYHGCAGRDAARVLLVPDDLPLPAASGAPSVIVTAAYTGRDQRADGAPAPVGIAVIAGRVIGRTLARMDGILMIDADGRPQLMRADAVALSGTTWDLQDPTLRAAFLVAAGEAGVSAVQSHLLIIDGRVDTRPVDDAPVATRRVFYQRGDGFGVWQSAEPMTLDQAARAVAADVAPDMALNLDMGSFNFCLARAEGVERSCGLNAAGWEERLSTLLMLYRR
ncbi:MAG: hypothetical protein AAF899_03755 [Pseudomonadota bacterium]